VRWVWGSNIPIEKMWTDNGGLLRGLWTVIAHPTETKQQILSDNAVRLYRLTEIA
jgi:predicted TIM-barrel fold metal-dependent hydrolase